MGMRRNHLVNLFVFVIYSKVASKMFLFSESSNDGWPYSRSSTKSFTVIRHIFFLWRMISTLVKSLSQWVEKKGQVTRKWWVFSTPFRQEHCSEGVSIKWCCFLWWRRWESPTLSWKIYLRFVTWHVTFPDPVLFIF